MKLRLLLIPIIIFMALPAGEGAFAQVNDYIEITRVDVDSFPKLKVYVRAFCNGLQQTFIEPTTIRITDGDSSRTATVACPIEHVPISVGLCLDRSSSVSGTTIQLIRAGAYQFVSLMQDRSTGNDEALIISFSENLQYNQTMTSNKQKLNEAIFNIIEYGNTAMWDAVMFTLQEVANNANNPIRAVIVLSDGGDNSSFSTMQEVINFSRVVNVPVYTIGLLYHTLPDDLRDLQRVADSTGGKFIPIENPYQIIGAFEALSSIIPDGQNDCSLDFVSGCADGSMHMLAVEVQACNRTLVDTVYYRVPLDPNIPKLHVYMDTTLVYEGSEVLVPIMISNPGPPARLENLDLMLPKPRALTFLELIKDGHVAEQMSLAFANELNELIIELSGGHTFSGTDTLLVLRYRAQDLTERDTIVELPYLFAYKKTDACMQLLADPGYVKIIRRGALGIECEADTIRIAWDDDQGKYIPEEFVMRVNVRNPSPLPVEYPFVNISLPPGVVLARGAHTVYLTNTTLASGASESVEFYLRAVPADSARSLEVCITAKADSTAITRCCTRLEIERAKPLLVSACQMPFACRWVDSLNAYEPAVIPVTMRVANLGQLRAKDVEAWIHAPPGFEVDSATPINTYIEPRMLKQNDSGFVTWFIRPLERTTSDTLEFCIKAAAGGDTSLCCQKVYITASPIRAGLICADSKIITFSDETKEYNPSQFLLTVDLRNNSAIPMERARARITLPAFVQLAPGDAYQKDIPGGGVLAAGQTVRVLWSLVASGEPVDGAKACIEVFADNYNGGECCTPIQVLRNVRLPRLTCSLDGPDTIRFVQTAYQPNPFVLNLHVKNAGDGPAMNVFAALLQGADLSIDASDQALKKIADSLTVNQEIDVTFTIRVLNRLVTRADTIRVSVYADNGGAVVCEIVIIIEAVRGPIIELACSGPDSLTFNDATNLYEPSPFTLRLVATNTGTADTDTITAEFLAGPNIELISSEKAAKLLTPLKLKPTEIGEATWQVNAVPRTVGRTDTVYLQVRVKGTLLKEIVPCPVLIYIPPVRKAALQVQCEASAEIQVVDGAYVPDPLELRLSIANLGDAFAYDVKASTILPPRLAFANGDTPEKTAASLNPQTGQVEFNWQVSPIARSVGDTVDVCFSVRARFHNEVICCVKLYIPPIIDPTGDISVTCAAIDTVRGNDTTRMYPPISISSTVTNPTTVTVDSVRAVIILPNGMQLAANEQDAKKVTNLSPGSSENLLWAVDVLADTSTVAKARLVRIQFFANGKMQYCDLTIIVMPFKQIGGKSFAIQCASPDSIFYIDAQTGLQPSPFQVSVTITNTGTDTLRGYTATLGFPAQVSLATGETPTVQSQESIPPGGKRTATWRCVPTIRPVTNDAGFSFTVSIAGLDEAVCTSTTVIEGAKTVITISIPTGNVVGFGQTVLVPVNLSNPSMASFTSFDIGLDYDPTIVQLQGISRSGTLTEQWSGTSFEKQRSGSYRLRGTGSVPISSTGVLLHLTFAGIVDEGGHGKFDVLTSPLDLTDAQLSEAYTIHLVDGDITSSGSCVMPLDASELFVLEQNRPNPFNPVTTISYRLPASFREMPTEIAVYDTYGRIVRHFDEGLRNGGQYSVSVDGTGLESGIYFYRLSSGPYTRIKKMVFMK